MKRPAGPAARTLFPTWSLRLLTEERGSCRRNDKRPVFNSLCKHRWVILEKRFIETLAVRQNLDCWSGMRHFHKPEAFLLLYNAPLFCFVYFTRKEVSKLTRSFQPAVRRLLLPWTYRRFSSGVVFFFLHNSFCMLCWISLSLWSSFPKRPHNCSLRHLLQRASNWEL